jgi:hypothetical protein
VNKTYYIGEGLISKMHWQGFSREDITAITNIDPSKFESLILSLGWKPAGFSNEYHIWQKLEDRAFNQITIPVSKKVANYTEALLYAVYDVYLFEDITNLILEKNKKENLLSST